MPSLVLSPNQFETSTGTGAQIPVANTSGHVQIKHVGLWVPT